MECQENIENPIESDSNFAPIFVNHHLLPEISFSWHYLTKNNISFPKKVINLYIFYIYFCPEAWKKISLFLEPVRTYICILIIKIQAS